MKRIPTPLAFTTLALTFALLLSSPAAAQVNQEPPYYYGRAFTYCQAKAHRHTYFATAYGRPANPPRGFVPSSCNNGGNTFFGNTLRVRYWGVFGMTFWFDWSADEWAGTKFIAFTNYTQEAVTVRYCVVCKMAVSARSLHAPD